MAPGDWRLGSLESNVKSGRSKIESGKQGIRNKLSTFDFQLSTIDSLLPIFLSSHRYAKLDAVNAYLRYIMTARFKLSSAFANYQSYRRQLAVLASLGFATALCLGLLELRSW